MGASLFGNIWAATHTGAPPDTRSNFDVLNNNANADARIPVIYGTRKWGGYQTWHSTSKDKKTLTKDVVLCEGPIDSITSVKANNIDMGAIVTQSFSVTGLTNVSFTLSKNIFFESEFYVTINDSLGTIGKCQIVKLTTFSNFFSSMKEVILKNRTGAKVTYSGTEDVVSSHLGAGTYGIPFTLSHYSGSLPGCSYAFHNGSPTQDQPDNYDTVGGYKNCAWIRAQLESSDQLQGSNPTITCVVKGLLVKDTRNNTTAYSENPAMCLRDYLLNKRYGLGRWLTSDMIDEDSFKECADYCDEVIAYYVPNSLSSYDAVQNKITSLQQELDTHPEYSQETRDNIQDSIDSLKKSLLTINTQPVSQELVTAPRYTLNIILADKQSHIDDIQQILAAFGGFLVFNGDKISLRMEKDTSISYAFTEDTICSTKEGRVDIKWETTSLADAPNQYIMKFYDPKNDYVGVKVQVNDFGNQKERGKTVTKEITLNGITSQSQALRLGRMYLAKTKMCYGVCTFSTGTYAMHLQPGDVITITHGILLNQPMRILQTAEENGKWTIKCQQWNSSIYSDYLDQAITYKNYSMVPNAFTDVVPDVTDVTFDQKYYIQNDGSSVSTITGTCAIPSYFFYSSCDIYVSTGGSYSYLMNTATGEFTMQGAIVGQRYTFKIVVVNSAGRKSSGFVSQQVICIGKDTPPPDVTAVLVETLAYGTRRFSWDYTYPDPNDIAGFRIKYNAGHNTTWSTGTSVTADLIKASPWESQAFKSGIYTVMIKAVDNGGNESADITYAVLGIGDQIENNIIWTDDLSDFSGKKTRCGIFGGSKSVAMMYSSDILMFYTVDTASMYGVYTVTNPVLKGYESIVNMYSDTEIALKYSDELAWFYKGVYGDIEYDDSFTPDGSGLLSFDYDADGSIEIYYRRKFPYSMYVGYDNEYSYSEDDTLMYKEGPWVKYYGKVETVPDVHEIKVKIAGGHIRPVIRSLKAIVDVPDVVETINDFSVPEEGAYIPLSKTFTCIKNVSVTIQDVAASNAVSVRITGKETLKPYITLYGTDSFYTSYAGKCSGLVDITVQGY